MQKDPEATPIGDFGPDADRTRPDPELPPSGSPDPSQPDSEEATTGRWVTVQGAADALGITVEAVRARTRRGTLPKEKASDGTVYVWLDADQYQPGSDRTTEPPQPGIGGTADRIRQDEDRTGDQAQPNDPLFGALHDQIDILRAELEDRKEESRRKDAIIMSLSQRIPELSPPAPEGAQDWPETATDGESRDDAPSKPQEPSQRRSWLYRFFFGP
jgi:hypothetical protein